MSNTALYGIGGFGINIARQIERQKIIDTVHVSDTVKENLSGFKSLYAFKDLVMRGNGRSASTNVVPMRQEISALNNAIPPKDYNIVVASLSGGTGPSLAPIMINSQLEQNPDRKYFVLAVVGTEMLSDIDNAVQALARYKKIAESHNNVCIRIYFNAKDVSHGAVNKSVIEDITLLQMILSGQFVSPDDGDISTWINPSRLRVASDLAGQLLYLDIKNDTAVVDKFTDVVSMITTYKNRERVPMEITPYFNLQAEVPDTLIGKDVKEALNTHYMQRIGVVDATIDRIVKMREDMRRKIGATHRPAAQNYVDEDNIL